MNLGGIMPTKERPKLRLLAPPEPGVHACGQCVWFSLCHPAAHPAWLEQRWCRYEPSRFVRDRDREATP
jgi:hypothetical protein